MTQPNSPQEPQRYEDGELANQIELIINRAETAAENDTGYFAAMDNNPMNRQTIYKEVKQLITQKQLEARIDELVTIGNINGETIDAWASPAHRHILDRLEELTKQKDEQSHE